MDRVTAAAAVTVTGSVAAEVGARNTRLSVFSEAPIHHKLSQLWGCCRDLNHSVVGLTRKPKY